MLKCGRRSEWEKAFLQLGDRARERKIQMDYVCYRTKCNQIDEMRFSYAIMTEACLLFGSTERICILHLMCFVDAIATAAVFVVAILM